MVNHCGMNNKNIGAQEAIKSIFQSFSDFDFLTDWLLSFVGSNVTILLCF